MMRILALAIIFTTFATPAFAYIDAGLGSLVLQSLIAGFFTFMVFWRSWLDKVKGFFRGRFSARNSAASETAIEE